MFKKKFAVIGVVFVLMATFAIVYFNKSLNSGVEEPYNIVAINNTGEGIKYIGYFEDDESGGVTNADNSLMKNGQKVYLNIESEKFKLQVTDKNGKETVSQELSIDLDDKDKTYQVSIEKNKNGNFIFIMK
ncbi:MAG: hypothetical protein MR593_02000 [Intestinibacter sp.]|uniref:hypothetical protein n=1 Tax=Intestinibacter sp. TaxID=1965304 RepID=UPI0025C6195D|nr:hypothetical protein [Intestinibacter sp.]MCI6736882.1 hypothetical protein [Intestinibacter sp.]